MNISLYNLPFVNVSGEVIPAYAVMQSSGWVTQNDRDYFQADKPDGNGTVFLVNGPYDIPIGGDGLASVTHGVHAGYDDSITPTANEEWGPVAGSWLLSPDGEGFVIVGDNETIGGTEVVRIAILKGGTSTTTTTCRALEFIGLGGPLPFATADPAIGLIWSGLIGNQSGYDWQGGELPADLNLWGVGTVAPLSDDEDPIDQGGVVILQDGVPVTQGELAIGTEFLAVNCTNHWIFAGSLLHVEGRRIVQADGPTLIWEEYKKTGSSTFTQKWYAADGQRHENPPFTDTLEAKRNFLEMPSTYSIGDLQSVRTDKIASLAVDETAYFLHATGRLTTSESSTLRLNCLTQPEGTQGNVIYAEVDGTVTSGDPTGSFINAVAIVGDIPAGGSGTFQNQYGQDYASGDHALLFQRQDNGQWLTERGGSSGSQVVSFRLVQDKSYSDTAKLAKPINADGTLNSGADSFYVVDHEHQFWGLSAYTDGTTEAASHAGYYGEAVRYIDDYSGGVPGYRILKMEGPAQFLKVTLTETVGATTSDAAGVTVSTATDVRGRPFSGRLPRLEDDSPNITVFDDLEIAGSAETGDVAIAKWDENGEYYIFWRLLKLADVIEPGLVIAQIGAATIAGSGTWTVTYGSQANAVVRLKRTGAGVLGPVMSGMSAVTVTGLWRGKTPLRASSTEPIAVWGRLSEDGFEVMSEMDLRGIPGFNTTDVLLPGFNASAVAELEDIQTWIDRLAGFVLGNKQSIGHDAGSHSVHQDDDDTCPEA